CSDGHADRSSLESRHPFPYPHTQGGGGGWANAPGTRVLAYQAACGQIIARYEGHIAQYLGDGVLEYCGYPAAHGRRRVRAVRTGLEIVAAVDLLEFWRSTVRTR